MILTARTTRGREKTAIDAMRGRIKSKNYDINAVFKSDDLKGYIFIEGEESAIRSVADDVRNINGIIDSEVDIDEIRERLSQEQEEIKLEEGDEVEVVGGAFKGEEAKIKRIDETNREVTIELLDAAVPIPTTVDADTVRRKAQQ